MVVKVIEESLGTGRRKRAVASVRLRKGTGSIQVNGKPFEQYFPLDVQRSSVVSPIILCEGSYDQYDIIIRANGGGIEGQVIAARLGIARALFQKDEDLKQTLKSKGYLKRDPRRKERKKYGLKKARKRFQFSKR